MYVYIYNDYTCIHTLFSTNIGISSIPVVHIPPKETDWSMAILRCKSHSNDWV